MVGFREALMLLHLRELRHGSPTGVVAPYAEGRRESGVLARHHPRIVEVPLTRVDDHLIADRDTADVRADGVDDAARI